MAVNYTPTQASIETGSTQYNVQPNLTTARAFQNLERGILSGMQYKEQVEEDNFRRKQTDLRNTMTTFQEEYANASWAERQQMAREMDDLMNVSDGRDNRWNRELDRMGNEFSSRVRIQVAEESERRAAAAAAAAERAQRNRTIAEQQISYLELQTQLQETTDVAVQRELTNNFYADNVLPYADSDDPDMLELYARGLSDYNRVNEFVIGRRRALANEQITSEVIGNMVAHVASQGGIDPASHNEIRSGLEARSDYAENRSAIESEFANLTVNAVMAQYNSPDFEATQEDVDVFNTQLRDLAEADPYIVNSTAYRTAQNFGSSLQATVNQGVTNNLQAMLADGNTSNAIFEQRTNEALERGVITEEQASNLIYQKQQNVERTVQRDLIVPLVQNGDAESLRGLVDNAEVNISTVQSTVGDLLQAEYDQLSSQNPDNLGAVNSHLLERYKSFQDQGLAPTRLDAVDQALRLPRRGEQMSDQDVMVFMQTYNAAREAGYYIGDSRVTADYLQMEAMIEMGVPDVGATIFNARQNRISVRQAAVDESVLGAIGANNRWTEDLNPQNTRFLMDALRPVARTMMEGGYSPDDVSNFVERSLESDWMRADPRFGGSSEVWIPRTEEVPNEGAYNRAYSTLSTAMRDQGFERLDYLAPLSANDPTGQWIAIDRSGRTATFTNEEIGIIGRTGRLPQ